MLMKSMFVYLAGEVLSKAIPFMLMPYLSRSLGVDGFGELTLYQAWAALSFIFLSYIQDAAIIRYVYFYGVRSVGLIVMVGRIYTLIAALIGLFFSFIYEDVFLLLVILCSLSQSLLKVEMTIQQSLKQPVKYIAILMCSSLFTVLFTVILFEFISATVINRIISLVLGNFLCVFFAFLFFSKKYFCLRWGARNIKLGFVYLFSFSSPLILNSLSTFCKGQFDRLLISERFSMSELGEYAAGFQLASIFLLLLLAVSRAVEPYFYTLLKNNKLTIDTLLICTFKFLPFVFVFVFLMSFIPSSFYVWFLGNGFDGVKIYVVEFFIAFSVLAIYMVYSMYLNFYGKTKEIAYSNLISIFFYLFFLFVFSGVGVEYIAFATIFSNLILVFCSIYFSFKLKVV